MVRDRRAAFSIVPIARFVSDHIFALKGGGYGCLFALAGLDEECLTDQEIEAHLRLVEGALRGLPEGACLYQYRWVMSGFDLPRRETYSDPVTQEFVDDRLRFLEETAGFRRIDLHWCLTLEPPKVGAFERNPQQNAAATSRMLVELEKAASLLAGNLCNSLGLRLLSKNPTFQFFSYLFNLQEWASQGQLVSDTGVDRQIVQCRGRNVLLRCEGRKQRRGKPRQRSSKFSYLGASDHDSEHQFPFFF